MPRELTDLLALRTAALQNFRAAFRANDTAAADGFRAEAWELQARIDEATERLAG